MKVNLDMISHRRSVFYNATVSLNDLSREASVYLKHVGTSNTNIRKRQESNFLCLSFTRYGECFFFYLFVY